MGNGKMKKEVLTFPLPKKNKYLAMLAPSFIVYFSYPKIICKLKNLGFDKAVELTFGAKMINRDYHKILEKTDRFWISSVCPGIVETLKNEFPRYKKNLIPVDSPMIAMSKICHDTYPNHKIVFFSPCNFKKTEALKSKYVDYVIDYKELKQLLKKHKIKANKKNLRFDKFYNDYTKIYPVSGGLSETARVKNILHENETKILDGIQKLRKFLDNKSNKSKFIDVTFCKGGCIGGPCINSKLPILLRKAKVLDYVKRAKKESIPENRKGLVKIAKGISFKTNYK